MSSKEKMILAALDLFHSRGVNATGISEVLKRSKTGKGQFTHYFKNKDGLIREVVSYLIEVIRSGQAGTGYDIKDWVELEGWFESYIVFQKSVACTRSCPLGTIGNDLNEKQEIIRQDLRLFFSWAHSKLARFFAERKAAGELSQSADPDGLADLLITVMQGGMLVTKIERKTEIFERAAQQALNHIQNLRRVSR